MEKTEENKRIVFVCTGNTCRSPMAEAVFSSEVRRRGLVGVQGYSAGISARGDGQENINLKSATVLAENGYTVQNVQARKLDSETLKTAFAFVCMTDSQRDYLMELRWNVLRQEGIEVQENNVYSFSELCGYEIPDPYGKDTDEYRKTFSLINAAMPPLFEKFFTEKTEEKPKKKRGRPRKNPVGDTGEKSPKKSPTKKTSTKTKKNPQTLENREEL